jgi:hypothetical protein
VKNFSNCSVLNVPKPLKYSALFALGFFSDQHPFGFSNYKKILKLDCGLTVYGPRMPMKARIRKGISPRLVCGLFM